jgi:hypothetical protein
VSEKQSRDAGTWKAWLEGFSGDEQTVGKLVINSWVDWLSDIAKEENKRILKQAVNGMSTGAVSQWTEMATVLITKAKSHDVPMPDLAQIKSKIAEFEASVNRRKQSEDTDAHG